MSFNVTTNNVTGYMLSISAKTGTDLTNSTAGTSFTSLSTANGIDATTFDTTTYNNQWGFKPNYYKSTANTDKFYPSPTTSGVTLNKTESANTNADTYTIAIGARATYSQPAGTYSNTYILSAVGNYPTYSITYVDNLGTNDTLPSPNPQTPTSDEIVGSTITLSSTTPTRSGYTFQGWCTANNSANVSACTGTTYQPGASYTVSTISANSTTLYAIWEEMIYMQNLASSECTTTARQVYDIRDGSKYWIQRLADGNCWMTQNLNYSITADDVANGLTSETTDLVSYGSGAYADGYSVNNGIITWKPTRATIDATNVTNNSIPGWSNSASSPYSVDPGNWYWMGNPFYTSTECNYLNGCTDKFTKVASDNTNGEHGHVGNYYNWLSAVASNNTSSLANSTYDNTSNNPGNSICPAGWRLPTISSASNSVNGSTNEFSRLIYLYNSGLTNSSQNLEAMPLYFVRAGYPLDTLVYAGRDGSYWSSTSSNGNLAYSIYFRSGSVAPADVNGRGLGLSIRCIMKSDTEKELGIRYMQDITADNQTEILAAMTADKEYTLTDVRDGNAYTVKKINDQLWMTQNLRFMGTELNSITSNVASTYTASAPYYVNGSSVKAYYNLDSSVSGSTYANHCDGTNGYNYACAQDSGDATKGVWYNYAAASAGTVTGSSNSQAATHDICPAGWHLPSGPNATEDTDFNKLVSNTTSGWQPATSGLTAFGAVAGSYYRNGSPDGTEYGFWWSATAYDATDRYGLGYNSGNGQFYGSGGSGRYLGFYIRCVLKGTTIDTITYMQDVTTAMVDGMADLQEATLTDSRDGQDYTVKKINGQLWMTRNLAIGCNGSGSSYGSSVSSKSLTSANSNVSTNFSTPTALLSAASSSTSTADYSTGRMQCSSTYGAWYNYYAASAGTISTNSNTTVATSSICPLNWKLPTGPNTTSGTDFNKLVGNTTSGWQDPTDGLKAFGAVAGGTYSNGSLYNTGSGLWWSATASDATYRYFLRYNSSDGQFGGDVSDSRYYGFYVRCVRS